MTDKQIIIDGCDVSGCTCRYYAYNRHLCSIIGDDLCEEHSDCLYKQYKRKEKECEELKEQLELNTANAVVIDMAQRLHKFKQTLQEIKEITKKTLNMVDYKTYFKRDNKSLKQEGFKALNEILQKISEVKDYE